MELTPETAEERACEIGRRIREAVDRGEFKLTDGYLGQYHLDGIQYCAGCAVAAAAYLCGARGSMPQNKCQQAIDQAQLMTREEAAQLEMGYECWRANSDWTGRRVARDIDSPFYALGRAMSLSSKHTWPEYRAGVNEPTPKGGW